MNIVIHKPVLFIASPMHDARCDGEFASSMMSLAYALGEIKRRVRWSFRYNDSVLPSARNQLVDEFLNSDADYLLFVDSDISFTVDNVIDLLDCANEREDVEIVAGAYPFKDVQDFPIELIDKVTNPNKPVRVVHCGAGFMLIKRSVFEKFKEAYPEQHYLDDMVQGRKLVAYFDFKIDENRYYMGEDVMFSDWCRKIGVDTWVLPSVSVSHRGNYIDFSRFTSVV
jgi:GT2 family glycosyltransferase